MPLSSVARRLMNDPGLTDELEAVRITALRSQLLQSNNQGALLAEEGTDFDMPRVQRNLALLSQAVQRLARNSPTDPELQRSALFVARGYEQLADLQLENSSRLRLTAAVHYELAGYQANAATMARMAYNVNAATEIQELPALASAFMQRRFLRCAVEGEISRHTERPPAEVDAALISRASFDLARQALGQAAFYFLTGDHESIVEAVVDLEIVYSALMDAGLALDALLISSLRSLLPRLEGVSTWSTLSTVHSESRLWRRYLGALGRGLAGRFPLDLRSISELWPSQRYAVSEGILEGGSRVIRMPTSAGKTRIAEMVIVNSLASRLGSKALYVAPFNALSAEVEQGFNDLFTDLGLSLSALTGAFDASDVEEAAQQDDLLIVTPEKLDQLLRSDSGFIDEVDVVVLDEGHIVGDEQRGPKYEMTVTRLQRRRPAANFIALSAVVPDDTLADFSAWLKAGDKAISSPWRPTIQRMARLRWREGVGDLVYARPGVVTDAPSLFWADEDSSDALTVRGVVRSEVMPYQHPETRRMRRPTFPEVGHRAQVAAAYAWQVVDQGPVLVYCQKPQDASAVSKALDNRRQLAEWRGELAPNALAYRRRRSAVVAEEWLGPTHEVTVRLLHGIGVHHSTLPEAVKNAIEDDFRDRELGILAATGTLAQGVNLPVRTLIVHTTRRFDEDLQITIPMRARDFWNIAGRVGRAGAETEGTVVFLDFNANDRSDFFGYVRSRDNVEPVESALSLLLHSLVQQRISQRSVAEQLDPEMLALLVEENEGAQSPEGVGELMAGSLVAVQAMRERRSPEPMWNVMAATASIIARHVDDPELRHVFASTGLSAVSCVAVRKHVLEHRAQLTELFADPSQHFDLMTLMIDGLSGAREMSPRYSVDPSHIEILERWLDADPVGEIASRFGLDAVHLTGFIEDYFGYRLPWGVSGYMRIAQRELGLVDLPRHVSSTPALVRYGVPSEVAAWAMALGVPSRAVALHLSERYLATTSEPSSYGLRRWLAGLDTQALSEEVGLSSNGVQAATRAVLRAHGNDHLRKHYLGEELLPLHTTVRFFSPASRYRWAAADDSERILWCARDYDSSYRNAVVLQFEGHTLARLPRAAADVVALEMDAGRSVVAREDGDKIAENGVISVVLEDASVLDLPRPPLDASW